VGLRRSMELPPPDRQHASPAGSACPRSWLAPGGRSCGSTLPMALTGLTARERHVGVAQGYLSFRTVLHAQWTGLALATIKRPLAFVEACVAQAPPDRNCRAGSESRPILPAIGRARDCR
jgi:hypothetical protein